MLTIVFNTMPRYLSGMYQIRTITYDLRGSITPLVPCVKTTPGLHSFRYASTTKWNGLPEDYDIP